MWIYRKWIWWCLPKKEFSYILLFNTWFNPFDRDDGLLSTYSLIRDPTQFELWRDNWKETLGPYLLFAVEPEFVASPFDKDWLFDYSISKSRLNLVAYNWQINVSISKNVRSMKFFLLEKIN